jgi:hypothetical protein
MKYNVKNFKVVESGFVIGLRIGSRGVAFNQQKVIVQWFGVGKVAF